MGQDAIREYCKSVIVKLRERVRGEVYWKYFDDTDQLYIKITWSETEFYSMRFTEITNLMWTGKSTGSLCSEVENLARSWIIRNALTAHFNERKD